jgi:ADP-ribose pyrophosphatase YjhB (NUDIX family)
MRVRCVGAVIIDGSGRLLAIRRGRPPGEGLWSIPGGRVEPGETDTEALVREVAEETGLHVTPGRLIGSVDRPGPGTSTYEIHDYAATPTPPLHLRPGDDAADARWVTPAELRALPTTPGLLEALTEWEIIPTA